MDFVFPNNDLYEIIILTRNKRHRQHLTKLQEKSTHFSRRKFGFASEKKGNKCQPLYEQHEKVGGTHVAIKLWLPSLQSSRMTKLLLGDATKMKKRIKA